MPGRLPGPARLHALGQMKLDDYGDRQQAQNPLTPPKDIESVFANHKFWLTLNNPRSLPPESFEVLRALASNPQSPPNVLAKLLKFFPTEVMDNPMALLLGLENPAWILQHAPDPVKKHLAYQHFMNMLFKNKMLRFTGYSYFLKKGMTSRNYSDGDIEYKPTTQDAVFVIRSGGYAHHKEWYPTMEDAIRATTSYLVKYDDAREEILATSGPSKSSILPESTQSAPSFTSYPVDPLADIKSYLAEERGDLDQLRANLTHKKATSAGREDCHKQGHSKGHGTVKYPYAWHAKKGACEPLPVHVAADTTDAHERSGRAERAETNKATYHAKASESHAAAAHIARKAGYHDLADKHKEHAEKHREAAVTHAHENAKKEVHARLTKKIQHHDTSEEPKDTAPPKPPEHKNPPSRGQAATRVL